MNFFKKLLLFTFILMSQAYSMDLKDPKLCQGFVCALAEDFQQEYRDSNKNWPTCSNAASYTYKGYKLCPVCLLNAYSADIFTPLIDDDVVFNIDAADMMTLSSDTKIYNPNTLDQKNKENIAKKAAKVCAGAKDIQPFVHQHNGVPGCTGFETMVKKDNKGPFFVGSIVVPDDCLNCRNVLVKQKVAREKSCLLINPSLMAVDTLMGIAGFGKLNSLSLALKDEKTTAEIFGTMPRDVTVECLLIAGDHGLPGKLFSWQSGPWRKQVVEPLISAGFKAKIIIIDSCYSASMIDCFKDLLTPNGLFVGGITTIAMLQMTGAIGDLFASKQKIDEKAEKTSIASEDFLKTIKKTILSSTRRCSYQTIPYALGYSALAFREICDQTKKVSDADKAAGAALIEWIKIIDIISGWERSTWDNAEIDHLLNPEFFAASDNAAIKRDLQEARRLNTEIQEIDALNISPTNSHQTKVEKSMTLVSSKLGRYVKKFKLNHCKVRVKELLVENIQHIFTNISTDPRGLFEYCGKDIEEIRKIIESDQLKDQLARAKKVFDHMLMYNTYDPKGGEIFDFEKEFNGTSGIIGKLMNAYKVLAPCEYCIFSQRDNTLYYDDLYATPAVRAMRSPGAKEGTLRSPSGEKELNIEKIREIDAGSAHPISIVPRRDFCEFIF